jgi:hypothetical protein
LYSGAILYSKLIGIDQTSESLKKQIRNELKQTTNPQKDYSTFLAMLALYHLEDFVGLYHLIKQYKSVDNLNEAPCPVIAAATVLLEIAGKSNQSGLKLLNSFYGGKGGFLAVKHSAIEDLLSTAVALYAMNFLDSDLRLIRPDCIFYIDSLYHQGGFRATEFDVETDIEYTFYGLLALGTLKI